MSYYLGFDVVIRDAAGVIIKQPGLTVNVRDAATLALITTVTTGTSGIVPSGELPATAAGTLLKFDVTGYGGFINRTAVALLGEAVSEAEAALVIEDNLIAGVAQAAYAEVWYSPDGNEKNARLVGKGRKGDVLKLGFQPRIAKTVKFWLVAVGSDGNVADADLSNAAENTIFNFSEQETVAASTGLTKETTVVNSAGATTQTLPTATGVKGKRMTVKNTGAGKVTLATTAGQTIFATAAASSLQLFTGDAVTVESDGANWIVI
jgi:hypothetical protein